MDNMRKRRNRYLLASAMMFLFSLSFMPTVYALEGTAPVISGDPIVIQVGGTYDPLAGIKIVDDVDTEAELLSKMAYNDNVNKETVGAYEIFYFVTDSDRNEGYFYRPVLVLDPELPLIYAGYASVEKGQAFNPMDNVFAYDVIDGDLTGSLNVLSDNVDTSVPGEYEVIFEVTDSNGNRAETTKWVNVYWPQEYYPVITAEDLIIIIGEDYDLMAGVSATDMTDGNLTANIKLGASQIDPTTPGVYWAQYTVENSLGLLSYVDRQVIVIDSTTSPVILSQDIFLETGMEFDPLTVVYAYDMEDGDITDKIIVVENTVDTSKAGDYFVRYKVTDSDGNIAEYTLQVRVDWSYENYPRIHLKTYTLYLPVNGTFDPMDGVTASDQKDGDLTDQIVVDSSYVDTSKPGEYYVEYTVTNSLGISAWEQMIVYVMDSSNPVLIAYDFSIGLNEELDIYMVKLDAYDLEDGDLRDAVTWDISAVDNTSVGTYPVKFQVIDSSGNMAETTSNVTVIDYSYPTLDAYDHIAYLNTEYNPLDYANAWDSMDGDLTDKIEVIKNTVKLKKPGTYYVTYSVTNSQDKTTTKTVSVEVVREPVMSFYLNYQGNRIPIETDESGNMAFITSNVMIPAGDEVGLAVYADGEPVFEYLGIINATTILPGLTYNLMINEENILITSIPPYLYNGSAYRYSPTEGEVQFKSTVEGTIYYAVAKAGSVLPEIDTSVNGIDGSVGLNTISFDELRQGQAHLVRIVIEAQDGSGFSNIIEIEIPKTPSRQNKEDNKPQKPDATSANVETTADPIIEIALEETAPEKKTDSTTEVQVLEIPEIDNTLEKKDNPSTEDPLEEVEVDNEKTLKKNDDEVLLEEEPIESLDTEAILEEAPIESEDILEAETPDDKDKEQKDKPSDDEALVEVEVDMEMNLKKNAKETLYEEKHVEKKDSEVILEVVPIESDNILEVESQADKDNEKTKDKKIEKMGESEITNQSNNQD